MDKPFLMDYDSFTRAVGGRRFSFSGEAGVSRPAGFSSVTIDSREVRPGALFVALPGSRTEGHRFVGAAFEGGAGAAVVSRRALGEGGLEGIARRWGRDLVVVEDPLRALQSGAAAYLRQFPALRRVGITGSSGKTTTKEIAAALAAQEKRVVKNRGNLNSETGLPLSVFEVREDTEAAIFELGMNRLGEIGELAEVLRPQIALITNIGPAHIGLLGSLEAIAAEKKAVFSRFTGTETALIPREEPFGPFLGEGVRGRVVFYDNRGDGIPHRSLGLEGTELIIEGKRIRFPLPGRHNLADALAAMAIARELGVSREALGRGLEAVEPLFGRGEILRGPVTVIRDCYNANPESLREALRFCDSLDWPGRRVYLVGSMLELGASSEEAHRELGRLLGISKGDLIFLYGEETLPALEVLRAEAPGKRDKKIFHFTDRGLLKKRLGESLREGDLLFLKGSRGCALEEFGEGVGNREQGDGISSHFPLPASHFLFPSVAAIQGGDR